MIDFLIDLGKYLFFIVAGLLFCLLILLIGCKGAYEIDKRNCYEIYATDNVILKKCEKYFERGKE